MKVGNKKKRLWNANRVFQEPDVNNGVVDVNEKILNKEKKKKTVFR